MGGGREREREREIERLREVEREVWYWQLVKSPKDGRGKLLRRGMGEEEQ